jgi:hypothetical protein
MVSLICACGRHLRLQLRRRLIQLALELHGYQLRLGLGLRRLIGNQPINDRAANLEDRSQRACICGAACGCAKFFCYVCHFSFFSLSIKLFSQIFTPG